MLKDAVRRAATAVVAIVVCLGAGAGAIGPVDRGPAASAATPSASNRSHVGAAAQAAPCSDSVDTTAYATLELFGVLPGLGLFFKIANALAKTARHGICSANGREMPVVEFMVKQMEAAAERIVDQHTLQSVYARSADLMLTLQREQANLEQVSTMTPVERTAFSTVMQTIGNTASQLEAEVSELPWQSLPAAEMIGGIKNGALALAFGLADPGTRKQHLRNVVLPAELEETRQVIADSEAQLVHYVRTELWVVRESDDPGRTPVGMFEIRAGAGHADEWDYLELWSCKRILGPRHCANFSSRRAEFFSVAVNKHLEERAKFLAMFTPEYLAFRNELTIFRGAPFLLTNNRVVAGRNKCLDVPGNPEPARGSGLQLWECEPGRAETDQEWRFVPGSGLVQNVRYRLCLDLQDGSDQSVRASRLVLAECAPDVGPLVIGHAGEPEYGDQEWAMHPLGYLVHLASGRCLDLPGSHTVENGAVAQTSPCEYGRSADVGARGASAGLKSGDPFTDQSWAMWFRCGSRPTVPAPLPPLSLAEVPPADTTPPVVSITSHGQQPASTSAVVEFSTDLTAVLVECQTGEGDFVPCASPYQTVSLTTGEHRVVVRAADALGNLGRTEVVVAIDAEAPETMIRSGPSGTVRPVDPVTFTLASSTPGSQFGCSLDGAVFEPCASPVSYGRLAVGSHVFKVEATAPNGIVDTSPETRTWTVRRCLLFLPATPCQRR